MNSHLTCMKICSGDSSYLMGFVTSVRKHKKETQVRPKMKALNLAPQHRLYNKDQLKNLYELVYPSFHIHKNNA